MGVGEFGSWASFGLRSISRWASFFLGGRGLSKFGRGRVFEVDEFRRGLNLDVTEFGTWASFGLGQVWDQGEFWTWMNFEVGEIFEVGVVRTWAWLSFGRGQM